jgi:hypothetical protein
MTTGPDKERPAPDEAAGAGAGGTSVDQSGGGDASAPIQKEPTLRVIAGGRTLASLNDLAPVRAYLRRVGATPVSFLSATLEERANGYPKVTGRITFTRSGEARVWGNVEPPSDTEAAAIREAFEQADAAGELPRPMPLAALAELPEGVSLSDPNVAVCHDFAGQIVMLHQRYETRDGGKGFIPWTRWSDGLWHKMEPEVMPFFGLPGHEDKVTLFLHEGAKAARRVKAILAGENDSRFPWREEVRWGHHVGWLGGVHAVSRSDWEALAARRWSRVVIVADNDRHGLRAAHEIAKEFPGNVFIVAFDQRFPCGFDCGDDWPEALFDAEGFYTGPSLADCLRPATWATRLLPAVGRGRPAAVIREEFAATVAYTVTPPRFAFIDRPSRDYSADEFNALVAPFSHVRTETATKLLSQIECQHERLIYDPRHRPGTVVIDAQRCFNVYEGGRVSPAVGDAGPWEEYLAHLIPAEEERGQVKRWLATLIARPAVRMRYGLLLISVTQGVGKNTLANVLKRLLGPANVSFPNESSIVDSQFNGWAARKRLIFIGEIYSGHSRKAYDKLKSVLADDDLEVNQKHVEAHRLDNWATVIACSNSEAALHLDDEDRRWFVPTVAETLKPPEWWQAFYSWFEGEGAGIILQWALDYASRHGPVRTGEHAPDSPRKRAIVEGSRSEGQQLAVALAEHLTSLPRRVILRISEVRRWIALRRGFRRGDDPDLGDRRLEKPATIIAAMKKVPGLHVRADALRPKFGATREAVVMNFEAGAEVRWSDIKEHLTDLEGISLDEPL